MRSCVRTPGTNPIAWRETSSRTLSTAGMLGRWGFVVIAALTTVVVLWLFHVGTLGLPDLRATLLAIVVAEVAIVGCGMQTFAVQMGRLVP